MPLEGLRVWGVVGLPCWLHGKRLGGGVCRPSWLDHLGQLLLLLRRRRPWRLQLDPGQWTDHLEYWYSAPTVRHPWSSGWKTDLGAFQWA